MLGAAICTGKTINIVRNLEFATARWAGKGYKFNHDGIDLNSQKILN
jgi:hypothetical protein